MLEKIRCPERESNQRLTDFMRWRSTTELPRHLQWDGQSLSTDYQAFAPRPLGLGITSVDRQTTRSSDKMLNVNEIGESWVRFPLGAPYFFQHLFCYFSLTLRHIRVSLTDDEPSCSKCVDCI